MTFKNILKKEVVLYSRKNGIHSRVIFPTSGYYLHLCRWMHAGKMEKEESKNHLEEDS